MQGLQVVKSLMNRVQRVPNFHSQFLSQDPLPMIGTAFALLQREEDHKCVMLGKDQTSPSQERSALVVNEGGGRGNGGREQGRGRGRGGGLGGCGRGQNNVDKDKLHCTNYGKSRHTRKYCWDLVGKLPRFNIATTVETEKHGYEESADEIDMNIT